MKKLGLIVKDSLENRIKKYLKDSDSVFVITYSKLSSPDLTLLRQTLKGSEARLLVTKNTIFRHALKDSGLEDLSNLVQGICGLVFIKAEPVAASKALCDFSKTHEQLKVEGGRSGKRYLKKQDIENIAKLPSKEVLRAQAVMALKSPITRMVMVLSQTLKKLVWCLDKIKEKQGASGKEEKDGK